MTMITKSVLITGAFALASLGIASAKSYDIRLDEPTSVGSTQLKPGEYTLKLHGSEAVFTDSVTSKTYKAPVKAENNSAKFDQTMVQTQKQNGADTLREIDLGGSTTKLEFGQ